MSKPIKDHQISTSPTKGNPPFGHFALISVMLLLLGSSLCGLSEEIPMVSLPLGSQISGHQNTTWVSQSGVFALGFLLDYQKDDGFVVGIWHNFGAGSEKVPVWTVGGGGVRVCENSTFELSLDGSLILFDCSHNELPVWSSNTGNLGVRSATLMDNGNLVLVGFGGKVIWESFASPTDTLLPGQPFRYPQSLQASSPNSIASYYSLKVKSFGEIYLVWEDNVTYWRSQMSSSVLVKEVRLEPDGLIGLFDYRGGVPWSRLSKDFKDPLVQFRRLRIDADGNLRIYSWDNVSSLWRVGWQAVGNQCDVFGSCGLYSVCSYNLSGPTCGCLNSDSVSGECQRMVDLGNCDRGLSMTELKKTVLYSLYPPHDVVVMLSLDACRQYCLNDTSCFAATANNDGSGICTIKKTSFISGYSYASVQAKSFLKVCLVPEAVSARAANFHGASGLMPKEQQQQQTVTEIVERHKNYLVAVVGILLITGFVFLVFEMAVFWFVLYKRRRMSSSKLKGSPFAKDIGMNPHYSALVRLSFDEVETLTKNFGNKLGPTVYKGILPNKITVAVKLLNNVVASEREFQLVVSTLGSTHHRNLVALKGFCYEPKHKLLIYEHVSNGSLDQWLLSKKQNRRGGWNERLNIAIGIARALAYLHLQCKKCIVHGDLKLENILLDDQFTPKLTDYGIQSLIKKEDAAASSSETLAERDVHMFGIILIEIVAGYRESHENKLRDLAFRWCEYGNLGEFVDPRLEGKAEIEGVQRVVKLALWCVQDRPSLRPSIGEVVRVLEGALSLDMPPIIGASQMVANGSGNGNLEIVEASF
ncbi:uncharacterized protein A4U43_C08F9380 [Asparagus officinalis]|uniref:G-type lectin S-receptor-like serine/threonine-protein kinase SD3-1 n=1 Tax=Asparagus officinalis TaxID=4686 RepID=UPI00098E733F|nr:G-type lectin S-receptor-like serine/threonine-protein kinase SD3-1 [Asparagus officinalis]ONK59694.1 uncharacterized protein A4U43_C08F9380 [Asparagus officinalis]